MHAFETKKVREKFDGVRLVQTVYLDPCILVID
jgi:hypothetical protein